MKNVEKIYKKESRKNREKKKIKRCLVIAVTIILTDENERSAAV